MKAPGRLASSTRRCFKVGWLYWMRSCRNCLCSLGTVVNRRSRKAANSDEGMGGGG